MEGHLKLIAFFCDVSGGHFSQPPKTCRFEASDAAEIGIPGGAYRQLPPKNLMPPSLFGLRNLNKFSAP